MIQKIYELTCDDCSDECGVTGETSDEVFETARILGWSIRSHKLGLVACYLCSQKEDDND